MRPVRIAAFAGLAIAGVLLAGCQPTAQPDTGIPAKPSTAAQTTTPIATPSAPVAAPHSPSRAARSVSPRPPSGHLRLNSAGAVLPDRVHTPGATNPAVTQATIGSTICLAGWTGTIRPPSSQTTALKAQQLASGYAYHGDTQIGDYEEDHLIPLELGGSPTSARNLWPEPYASAHGARVKDKVEDKLHRLVCTGALRLTAAQHAITDNWWTAYQTYVSAPAPRQIPPAQPAPAPAPRTSTEPPPPPAPPAPVAPAGATALCNDGSLSYAAHHQGACSHHGGVAIFYR